MGGKGKQPLQKNRHRVDTGAKGRRREKLKSLFGTERGLGEGKETKKGV